MRLRIVTRRKLVAVTVSLEDPPCAFYMSSVNSFYGRPNIPIGMARNGLDRKAARAKIGQAFGWQTKGEEDFAEFVLNERRLDGSLAYPRSLDYGSRIPEALSVLRKALVDQPDQSVVMIQLGNSANSAALLSSQPDSISTLSGLDLIRKKVRFLAVMGGDFSDKAFSQKQSGIDFYEDVQSAQKIFADWPTPIVDQGFEVGGSFRYLGKSIKRDYSYMESPLIPAIYIHSCQTFLKTNLPTFAKTCPHDHHLSDPATTLYSIRPDAGYFSLSKPGKITVLDDGNARFDENPSGTHFHLTVDEAQQSSAEEAINLLVSQPPVGLRGKLHP